jgi:hypothetical protein
MNGALDSNLRALSRWDPSLAARLTAIPDAADISLISARDGSPVPSVIRGGRAYPLHSTFDPILEGRRLHEKHGASGFVVFLGLGGGYQIAPFLGGRELSSALIVEKDASALRAVLDFIDMSAILGDERVRILLDPEEGAVEAFVLAAFLPAVMGSLSSVPLRARCDRDAFFLRAAREVENAASRIAADYAAQAKFGKRWFSHTLANLASARAPTLRLPESAVALVVGAGPSLETQIPHLRSRRDGSLLISSDTALPVLLSNGIRPDLALSIDCQQYGYHHALTSRGLGDALQGVSFVLDMASPPSLTRAVSVKGFFASGHPLSRYIARHMITLPSIDTSGGNVAYAAVALARSLGAREIVLYGVDYSYPEGKPYARGTYLTSYFLSRAVRLDPSESGFFSMVFGGGSVRKEPISGGFRYVNPLLLSYRASMEALLSRTDARITCVPGKGLPLSIAAGHAVIADPAQASASIPRERAAWKDFLSGYHAGLMELPPISSPVADYIRSLAPGHRELWATLLPIVPCLEKEKTPHRDRAELLQTAKDWAVARIGRILKNFSDAR